MKDLAEIIQGAKKKNQKSFKILFDIHWNYLYGYMLKTIQNDEIAEDIAVKTFAKAFDKINSYNSNYNFKTWLLTISKNLYKDFLREKNKNISGLSLTDTLKNYAQTGSEYTKILNQIIKQNLLRVWGEKNSQQ